MQIEDYYQELFKCFLIEVPNKDLIRKALLESNEEESFLELQDHIKCNLKESIKWSTAIGVIEAVLFLVETARNNNNILIKKDGFSK